MSHWRDWSPCHPSANQTWPCLASEIRSDWARSGCFGCRQDWTPSLPVRWLVRVNRALEGVLWHWDRPGEGRGLYWERSFQANHSWCSYTKRPILRECWDFPKVVSIGTWVQTLICGLESHSLCTWPHWLRVRTLGLESWLCQLLAVWAWVSYVIFWALAMSSDE